MLTSRDAADHYRRALENCGGRLVRELASHSDGNLRVALYESPAYDLRVAPIPSARLSINLRSVPVAGSVGGERPAMYRGRRYSAFYAPPGSDAFWRKDAPSRHLNLYFAPTLPEQLAGQRIDWRPDMPFADATVRSFRPLVDALEYAVALPGTHGIETALSISNLIVLRAFAERAGAAGAPDQLRVGRLRDYVREHADSAVRVCDLAHLSGLPVARFSRALREATGLTPHRFVLAQRLELARDLLADRRHSIASVATACGFSSQQHLTTTMRLAWGLTPAQLRPGRA